MKNYFLRIYLILLVFTACQNEKTEKQQIVFYVSETGNDANNGSSEKPFASLKAARDAIRQMKSGGELDKPVMVYIRKGNYYLDKSFILKPEDSGTEKFPITYQSYQGEEVLLSGGKIIDSEWQKHDENLWDTIHVKVSGQGTTSIKSEDGNLNGVNIYPNPAKNQLSVSFNEPTKGYISVINLSGQLAIKQQINKDIEKLDINELNDGIFILLIETDKGIITERFVKIN